MKDKVVLVTGGARGIGAAVVKRFAEEKAIVYFTYRSSKEEAEKLVRSLNPLSRVLALPCEVRERAQIERVVDEVLGKEDHLDILVNNAGLIRDGLFLTLTDEDWEEVLETNLGGVVSFCRVALRQMMAQGSGRIINISSIVGELGGFGQANYAASKAAVNALTKSLAAEFASKGVTVNAVSPGLVNTPMSGAVRSLLGDKLKEKIPMGFFAEPEDVAGVVAFLAKEEARYITGQVISVDGGLGLLSRR